MISLPERDWSQWSTGNSMDFVLSAMCKMGKKRWSFWKIIRWIWSLQILICRRWTGWSWWKSVRRTIRKQILSYFLYMRIFLLPDRRCVWEHWIIFPKSNLIRRNAMLFWKRSWRNIRIKGGKRQNEICGQRKTGKEKTFESWKKSLNRGDGSLMKTSWKKCQSSFQSCRCAMRNGSW